MISKVFLAVFLIGICLVNCVPQETLDTNDIDYIEFALYAEYNKPLDKYFKPLFNFLESNTKTVEKVKQDIIKIKQNLRKKNSDEEQEFVIENGLESVQNYRVS